MDTFGSCLTALPVLVLAKGVLDPDAGWPPSPIRTRESIVFSRSPLRPLRTNALRLSSGKPISLSVVSFDANDAVPISATEAPVPCEALGGDNDPRRAGWVLFEGRRRLDVEEADRRFDNPNILPVLGGRGGGEPSGDPIPSEPCRLGGLGFPSSRDLYWYFCRMNFSMHESASSTSVGIAGLTFLGL